MFGIHKNFVYAGSLIANSKLYFAHITKWLFFQEIVTSYIRENVRESVIYVADFIVIHLLQTVCAKSLRIRVHFLGDA